MIIKGKEYKLPKAFKTKWIKALRSGKYEQGSHYLQEGNKYCCLGVACRIQHPKMKLLGKTIINEDNFKRLGIINIPKQLKGDISDYFDFNNPLVEKLTKMNDSGRHSFKSIAAYIERYL